MQKQMNPNKQLSKARQQLDSFRHVNFNLKKHIPRSRVSKQKMFTFKKTSKKGNKVEILYDVRPLCSPLSDQEDSSLESTGYQYNRRRSRMEHLNVTSNSFHYVCDDIQLTIATFLDESDARALMITNKHLYTLLMEATFLWEMWCYERWPHLPAGVTFADDSCGIPNYPYLLSIAAENPPPTLVDRSTFTFRGLPLFRTLNQSPNTVQYVNMVGTGDRCIRSNKPMVCPNQVERKNAMFKLFKRNDRTAFQPFSSPFVASGKVILTPRQVSYFEISILQDAGTDFPTTHSHRNPDLSDCVAIGLSTKSFRCHTRMPGWDEHSYGYHGDDGGIFHASGDMLKRFGPSFGKGDTIGCGIDFLAGAIFFTLNGKFLGYGWKNLNDLSSKELYPTVGIDSNAPVECNFGQSNFKFDLCAFIEKQKNP